MLNKLFETPVKSDNPWQDDKLERQATAKQLTRILETANGPLVASVSAPFGMGKTFFAKRWVVDLRRQGKTAIYFNAWENDFAQNALVAFVESLRREVNELDLKGNHKAAVAKRVKAVIKVAAPALAKTATKAALRAGAFILVGDKVDDLVEAAVKGATDEVEKLASSQIDAFARERDSRLKFRKELAQLREEIAGDITSSDSKIYIIVDELDRCRPNYTIDLLESIKHLFDVEGFIFVLFMHEEQVRNTSYKLFGAVAGEDYLGKFIDYKFTLPIPPLGSMASHLYDAFKLQEVMPRDENDTTVGKRGMLESFCFFAKHFKLSLRLQIRSFTIINFVTRAYGVKLAPVLTGLVCLREAKPDIWKEVIDGSRPIRELAPILGYDKNVSYETDEQFWYYHGFLKIFFATDPINDSEDATELDQYAKQLAHHLHMYNDPDRQQARVRRVIEEIEAIEQITK